MQEHSTMDESVLRRWMSLEMGKVNDGVVSTRKSLEELWQQEQPSAAHSQLMIGSHSIFWIQYIFGDIFKLNTSRLKCVKARLIREKLAERAIVGMATNSKLNCFLEMPADQAASIL